MKNFKAAAHSLIAIALPNQLSHFRSGCGKAGNPYLINHFNGFKVRSFRSSLLTLNPTLHKQLVVSIVFKVVSQYSLSTPKSKDSQIFRVARSAPYQIRGLRIGRVQLATDTQHHCCPNALLRPAPALLALGVLCCPNV
jgi:hypothetical protein